MKFYFRNIGARFYGLLLFMAFPVLLYGQSTSSVSGDGKVFRAGAATSNITPPLGGGVVGGWNTPPASHVNDELHVRCLVLDDGETQLVFAIADNVGIAREVFDVAKWMIHNSLKIPMENILMSATHTHSATSAGKDGEKRRGWHYGEPLDEYQRFVAGRISDGVHRAVNNLEPARIGWGSGSVPQHVFNRRWKMKPGTPMPNPFGGQDRAVMNPGVANPNLLEPAGPTDPEVAFVSVQSADGRPIALLANYSLHYVGGVPHGHISADYFAVFADRMQELLNADRQNPPFVGIMTNGTSGDVNNINFRGPTEKNPPYAKMRKVADDVASEVMRVYKSLEHQDWVELKSDQTELTLEVRKPDAQMLENAEKSLQKSDSEPLVHRFEKVYAGRILQIDKEWPDQIDVVLQTFGIGDLGIAAIPFETFTEIGLEIKAKSPFKSTFTISLANGTYGYLPTPEQHKLGGYETWLSTNRVETGASVKIVEELLDLFSNLK